MFIIWHNKKCSKSRATLKLLYENNIKPKERDYLQDIPSEEELKEVCKILQISPLQITRKNENILKENNISPENLSDDKQIEILHKFPIAIERPIVISIDEKTGKKSAIIGRPPENILQLL